MNMNKTSLANLFHDINLEGGVFFFLPIKNNSDITDQSTELIQRDGVMHLYTPTEHKFVILFLLPSNI